MLLCVCVLLICRLKWYHDVEGRWWWKSGFWKGPLLWVRGCLCMNKGRWMQGRWWRLSREEVRAWSWGWEWDWERGSWMEHAESCHVSLCFFNFRCWLFHWGRRMENKEMYWSNMVGENWRKCWCEQWNVMCIKWSLWVMLSNTQATTTRAQHHYHESITNQAWQALHNTTSFIQRPYSFTFIHVFQEFSCA